MMEPCEYPLDCMECVRCRVEMLREEIRCYASWGWPRLTTQQIDNYEAGMGEEIDALIAAVRAEAIAPQAP